MPGTGKNLFNTSYMLLDFLFLIAAGTHLQRAAEPHYQMRQAKQVASSLSNKPTIKNDKGFLAVQ